MTHAINTSFLVFGLLLECGLLALFLARGLARNAPIFTALLAFYLLRSTLLVAIFGHIDPANYVSVFEGLSVFDLLLQALVAIEIASGLARSAAPPRRAVMLLPPVFALAATGLLAWIIPGNSPVPLDRVQAFDWLWLIALGSWALASSVAAHAESRLSRSLALGFAFYGAAGIVATSARILAATHRDARSFTAWSYVLPAVWVLVVAYWMVALSLAPDAHTLWLSSRSEAEGSASS